MILGELRILDPVHHGMSVQMIKSGPGSLRVGRFEQGRIQIFDHDGLGAGRALGRLIRPANQHGHSNTAFVGRSFAT